jgi:dephospho-CoA kinase
MLVVGLTGGAGSGKSSAARFFSELNVGIIDADHIAKDLLDEPSIAQQVCDHFGPKVCDKNGKLHRYQLRQVIFSDNEARTYLENLLHPLIRSRIIASIARCASPYAVVVIPLLVETQKEDYIDRILVIDVPESTQISRLTKRDGITLDEAQAMLAAQSKRNVRLAYANDVIENTGDLQQLKNKVHNLHAYYLQLAHITL